MRRHADQGAALILVVLMTLLLLAGLLVTTMKLGLSSRQTTTDQARTLTAQYAAESSFAAARSRLRDIQTILSNNNPATLEVKKGTTSTDMRRHAERFCQGSSANAWVSAPEFYEEGSKEKKYPDAEKCVFDRRGSPGADQFSVLAEFVTPAAYQLLPAEEQPRRTDGESLKGWWKRELTETVTLEAKGKGKGQGGSSKVGSYRILPFQVVQLTPGRFRFYLSVVQSDARGQTSSARADRVVLGQNSTRSLWWFEVSNTLNSDVLLTNHHRSRGNAQPNVNFVDQVFEGSVHTNEKFLFHSTSKAQFKGTVTSAGCTDLPEAGMPLSGKCTRVAGVYVGEGNPIEMPKFTLAQIREKIPKDVKFAPPESGSQTPNPNFDANYRALPENANDQQAAAKAGGLLVGNAVGIELKVGDAQGNVLTSYDTTTRQWNEEAVRPVYQYISLMKPGTCRWTGEYEWADTYNSRTGRYEPTADWNATPAERRDTQIAGGRLRYYRETQVCSAPMPDPEQQYRADKDGNLQKYDTRSGTWKDQGRKFNGVIYGDKIDSLRGPPRVGGDKTGDLSKMPPALASFSQIMIAAEKDVRIDSDLVMSQTPCTFEEVEKRTCSRERRRATNVLGILSQQGDVILSGNTPDNLNLHASLMASTGEVHAEDHDTRLRQGDVTLIGNLVENWYGAFGTVGRNPTGYGRNFTYDQRFAEGTLPPAAPVSPTWAVDDARQAGQSLDDLLWAQVARP